MLNTELESKLNEQITIEANASQSYLAMASWAQTQGLPNIATFFFTHAAEERVHMLKVLEYVNERNGKAIVEATAMPKNDFTSIKEIIGDFYHHEVRVTGKICELVELALKQKDFITYEFLQWFLTEQREEEALAQEVKDRFALVENSSEMLFYLEQHIGSIKVEQ